MEAIEIYKFIKDNHIEWHWVEENNCGGMVSCRLRAAFLSNYTELQAGGNASN